jgi:hypothetical protein
MKRKLLVVSAATGKPPDLLASPLVPSAAFIKAVLESLKPAKKLYGPSCGSRRHACGETRSKHAMHRLRNVPDTGRRL